MNHDEINVAVAQWVGWKWDYAKFNEVYWMAPDSSIHKEIPNYCRDLNAIHEAELNLTYDQWRIFLGFLNRERTIPRLMSMDEFHACWNATARQRSEALLRTLGLWKE